MILPLPRARQQRGVAAGQTACFESSTVTHDKRPRRTGSVFGVHVTAEMLPATASDSDQSQAVARRTPAKVSSWPKPAFAGRMPRGIQCRITGFRRTRIIPPSPQFWPPKSGRQVAGTCEIACDDKQFTQVGTIPGLIGGSAYKGSPCYKRSAGLQTPSGPRLSTWV